jgi:hypothetical protein
MAVSTLAQLQAAEVLIAAEIANAMAFIGITYQKDSQSFNKVQYIRDLQQLLLENQDAQAAVAPYELRSTMAGSVFGPYPYGSG